jgi:hypothetical protein
MIYVYGIVDRPEVELGFQVGLEGARLEVRAAHPMAIRPIAAIVSFHDQLPRQARLDALQQHHRVLEAAMTNCTVLPTRFGTTFADVGALERALTARQDQLAGLLGMLHGKVELAVRTRVSSQSGDRDDALDERVDRLFSALASQATAAVVNRREPGTMTAAFLVPEDAVQSFQQATARIIGDRPAVRASLTGPWPPYSFTDTAVLNDQMSRRPETASLAVLPHG